MSNKIILEDSHQERYNILSYITKYNHKVIQDPCTHRVPIVVAETFKTGKAFCSVCFTKVTGLRDYPSTKIEVCKKLLQIIKDTRIVADPLPKLSIDKINRQPTPEDNSVGLNNSEELKIADSLDNLGAACDSHGLHDKAIKFYEVALDVKELALGKCHPYVLDSLNNLGIAYNNQRQHDKAIQLHNRSLETRKYFLGKDHLSVALSYNNLATAYHFLGQNEKAVELCQEAREIGEKVSESKNIIVADFLNNLGILHHAQGKNKEAIEFFQQAKEISKNDRLRFADTLKNLGIVYHALGQDEEAIKHFEPALEIRTNDLGIDHPLTIEVRKNLEKCMEKSTDLVDK